MFCSKSSHARQEFVGEKPHKSVKLYSQRRGCAKICHRQTDQPGAHINGLLCCVPVTRWEGCFACCSYTKRSSGAAEHCKALQQGGFISSPFLKISPPCHLQHRWMYRCTGILCCGMCTRVPARTSSSRKHSLSSGLLYIITQLCLFLVVSQLYLGTCTLSWTIKSCLPPSSASVLVSQEFMFLLL